MKHNHRWRQQMGDGLVRCGACDVFATMRWVASSTAEGGKARAIQVMLCAEKGCKRPATQRRKDGSVVCKAHPE